MTKNEKIVQNKRKLTCSGRIPCDLIDPALRDNNSKLVNGRQAIALLYIHMHNYCKQIISSSSLMDKVFRPILYNACNFLSMLRLKLNQVSKRGH